MKTSFNSNNKANIVDALKDNISIHAVTEKLNLVPLYHLTQYGDELTGDCPTGHPSDGHHCFSINLKKNLFHCFSCKISGDIFTLVSLVNQADFKQSLRWLAEQFRPDLLPLVEQGTYSVGPEQQQYYTRAMLYEAIYELGKPLLYETKGQTALAALEARGYSRLNLEKTEWIYWPKEQEIRAHLLATWPNYQGEINALPLNGHCGDNFQLAFPYRDRRGQITGFMKRADNKRGFDVKGQTGVRWDSTTGLKKDDLFGLDKITKKTDTLVIVEGYPDALYLPALGFTNIVAVGQGRLSKSHVVGLQARNIKRVIISFDNDPQKENGSITGVENTEGALDLLNKAGIDAFVLDPLRLGQYKDPDELVVAEGITAFEQLVQNAELGAKWKARRILTRHDLTTDLGRDAALAESLAYEDAITNPMASKAVIDTICSGLNMPVQMLEPYLKDYHEKQALERLRDATEELLKDVSTELRDGNPVDGIALISDKSKELMLDYERAKVGATLSLDELIREKRDIEAQRQLGQLLGFKLNRFTQICQKLDGLQSGLYILGAYPNVGKTALLTCLMLDTLHSNQNARVTFCSMDDDTKTIINRCLAVLTQKEINSVQCSQPDAQSEKQLTEAYDYLLDLVIQGQLVIKDASEVHTMNDVETHIRQNAGPNNIVFIDGLYNVGTGADSKDLRAENVQRAIQVKRLSKVYNIPVITTGELRKKTSNEAKDAPPTMNDLMESGKYGYNADVVWLLYPQDAEDMSDEIIMTLKFGKNKLSSFKETVSLRFIRAKSTYIEAISTSQMTSVLKGAA